jgi:phosphoribosyl-ATP pyrophosphohydrolase/phosphoribosyl-AMP cyclohydrolase
VISAATDCDFDSLLFRVEVEGEGKVCHEGTRSCFTKTLAKSEPESSSALPEAAL